ncbi:MAG: cob(I)alamin adenosyltransferase [Planctomycetota bacterium]|jgi:cob(I)alamin adenosyltransferase
MVHLSRIYTKTGDQGETGLGDGTRVQKDAPRIWAYGEVDELGAVIGVSRTHCQNDDLSAELERIQNDLFDVGADLCVPQSEGEKEGACLRVTEEQVSWLEVSMDQKNADLPALNSFVLSGGSPFGAHLHLARCVARRAERHAVTLSAENPINPSVIHYLNRLSDYLFVLARFVNKQDETEVLWVPGGNR